jgi:outer membrane protein assembly factor BamD (BamD/ComL family)
VAPVPLPPSRLAEEAQNLVEARRLLRSGATTAALSALEQGSREFAGGRLEQEREALFIEALAQSGQTELARRRATVFLRNHPGSPHAADVKRHVDVQ